MIVSVKPPYDITPTIVRLVASVSEKIGEVNATFLDRPSPTLRKQNQIRTIHSSLSIEGNTLSQEQITALLENKRVVGPQKDITEVLNAVRVYERIDSYKPTLEKHFLKAHKMLMDGLIDRPGSYRNKNVGIVKGSEVAHVAPPAANVGFLMKNLFTYLKSDEMALIKSCVFHYEMEFIHPFIDGNGRMGRLWQTVILKEKYPVFGFLPFETLISKTQEEYYRVLALCDKSGNSTAFIEYMLELIGESLGELLSFNNRTMRAEDRMHYFLSTVRGEFSRKGYMDMFRDLSSATASRDLKKALEAGLISSEGEKNRTQYRAR